MAPTLTSNSFLLPTAPRSILTPKNPPPPRLTVSAEAFRLGKQDTNGANESEESSNKPRKFFIDFGKIPDVKSLVPVVSNPSPGLSFGRQRRKDAGTVFVAGASGQAGVRIAQALLRQGFTVRAGVSELGAAQELARFASAYKIISPEESKRLIAVESTFQDAESIAKTIGNASKVVVTIGPTENGPTNEVSTIDALQVIQASQLAGVNHVAIIYDARSLTSPSSDNNVLTGITSFFNNLFVKSQPLTITEFLQKIVETDVGYTLIKTNLTEDFSPESSYNVVVSAERSASANDYKVSKLQIASLVADVLSNTAVAENKVVEVSTDPSAPSKPVDQLFSLIPEDGRRKAYKEALAKAKAEEEALQASQKAREAVEAAKQLEEEVKKLSEQEARAAKELEEERKKLTKQEAQAASLAEEAQKKATVAGASVENFLSKAKDIGSEWSWDKVSSQIATAVQQSNEKPKLQIATVRGQAKARTLPPKKAIFKQPTLMPKKEQKPKTGQPEPKKETRKMFGGLFQQETIYIDDD